MKLKINKISMSNYPIIKIPIKLVEIYNAIPPLRNIPIRPNEPIRPIYFEEPKYSPPIKPTKDESPNYKTSLIVMTISGFILYELVDLKTKNMPSILIIIAGLVFLVSLFSIYALYSDNSKKLEFFEKLMKQYLEEVQTYKLMFPESLKKWKESYDLINEKYTKNLEVYQSIALPNYEQELNNYNIEKLRIQTINNLVTYRSLLLEDFVFASSDFYPHPTANRLSKGVTESSFFDKLLNEANLGKCFINVTPNQNIDNSYLPDITLELNSGIKIDIEIDEPYIGLNGKPIHYLNNDYDLRRDASFLNKRWIVVRFAEQQIVQHGENCIKVLYNLKKALEDFTNPLIDSNFIGDLQPIRHWTRDEAHAFAFRRLRNDYLNIELRENLILEQEEQYTIEETAIDSIQISFLKIDNLNKVTLNYNHGHISVNPYKEDNIIASETKDTKQLIEIKNTIKDDLPF